MCNKIVGLWFPRIDPPIHPFFSKNTFYSSLLQVVGWEQDVVHSWRFSGLTHGPLLRDHFWQGSGPYGDAEDQTWFSCCSSPSFQSYRQSPDSNSHRKTLTCVHPFSGLLEKTKKRPSISETKGIYTNIGQSNSFGQEKQQNLWIRIQDWPNF